MTAVCNCAVDPNDHPDDITHSPDCPYPANQRADYVEQVEKANGPPKGRVAWRDCFDRDCSWDAFDGRWGRHATWCPNTKAKTLRATRPAANGSRRRKLRPDDIGGLLVEVGRTATQDPRLTDVDRDVYYAMFGRAHGLIETEITAPRDWLEDTTGHPDWKCRTALKRLERFGYLKRIGSDEVSRQKLRNWLAAHTFQDGRLPGIYRMSLNPPRWDDVPDYAAPIEDGWRDRVDALLAV